MRDGIGPARATSAASAAGRAPIIRYCRWHDLRRGGTGVPAGAWRSLRLAGAQGSGEDAEAVAASDEPVVLA